MQRYEIIQKIGSGAYSQVFKAYDKVSNAYVAVKKVNHTNPDIGVVINRELRMLKKFNHPNIVKLLACFADNTYTYLILEYLQYDLITHYKQVRAKQNRKLRQPQINKIFYQVCSAICYMHNTNIMHRDIKPENVLINPQTLAVKIIDFGFASEYSPYKQNTNYMVTRWYRPPQIVLGLAYDMKADVFSLGALLLQLYNGEQVFRSASNLDQLYWICEICGYPNWLPAIQKLKSVGIIPDFSKKPCIQQMTKQLPFEAASLIVGMLQPIPQLRMSLQDVLAHIYFEEYSRPKRKLHSDHSHSSLHSLSYSTTNINKSMDYNQNFQSPMRRYDSSFTERGYHNSFNIQQNHDSYGHKNFQPLDHNYYTQPRRKSQYHFDEYYRSSHKSPNQQNSQMNYKLAVPDNKYKHNVHECEETPRQHDILKKRTKSLQGLQVVSLKKDMRFKDMDKKVQNSNFQIRNGDHRASDYHTTTHPSLKLNMTVKLKPDQLKRDPAFSKIRSKILQKNVKQGYKQKISLSQRFQMHDRSDLRRNSNYNGWNYLN